MPAKAPMDENIRFLVSCLNHSDYKTIDYHAVGKDININAPAARMRLTRLRRGALQPGPIITTYTNLPITPPPPKPQTSAAEKRKAGDFKHRKGKKINGNPKDVHSLDGDLDHGEEQYFSSACAYGRPIATRLMSLGQSSHTPHEWTNGGGGSVAGNVFPSSPYSYHPLDHPHHGGFLQTNNPLSTSGGYTSPMLLDPSLAVFGFPMPTSPYSAPIYPPLYSINSSSNSTLSDDQTSTLTADNAVSNDVGVFASVFPADGETLSGGVDTTGNISSSQHSNTGSAKSSSPAVVENRGLDLGADRATLSGIECSSSKSNCGGTNIALGTSTVDTWPAGDVGGGNLADNTNPVPAKAITGGSGGFGGGAVDDAGSLGLEHPSSTEKHTPLCRTSAASHAPASALELEPNNSEKRKAKKRQLRAIRRAPERFGHGEGTIIVLDDDEDEGVSSEGDGEYTE